MTAVFVLSGTSIRGIPPYHLKALTWACVQLTCVSSGNASTNGYELSPSVLTQKWVSTGSPVPRSITRCRGLSDAEKRILTEGCLMNYYAAGYGKN